jgi:hypothetical protein
VINVALFSGIPVKRLSIPASVGPGATALARTPREAASLARASTLAGAAYASVYSASKRAGEGFIKSAALVCVREQICVADKIAER